MNDKKDRMKDAQKIIAEDNLRNYNVGKLLKMCCTNAENATLQDAVGQLEIEEEKGTESSFYVTPDSLENLERMVAEMTFVFGDGIKLSDLLEIRKEVLGDLYDEEYEEAEDAEDGVLDEPEPESKPGSGDKINWKKEGF